MANTMTRCLAALALSAGMAAPALADDAGQACLAQAQTQYAMNQCAGAQGQRADRELNAVYQAVLKKHKDDKRFIAKLKTAQRAWLAWRDAELEATYPARSDPTAYGSVFPMCWSGAQADLTSARTAQLRQWLDAVAEGEMCAGSLPVRQ